MIIYRDLHRMENETKRILDLLDTAITLYPFYLAFARDLWGLTQSETPGGAAEAAARLVAKWHERGLDGPRLDVIRAQVFDIPEAKP